MPDITLRQFLDTVRAGTLVTATAPNIGTGLARSVVQGPQGPELRIELKPGSNVMLPVDDYVVKSISFSKDDGICIALGESLR